MNQQKFDFSVWERNCARKSEEREKTRKFTLARLDKALRVLSEKYFWHGIFVFGSVTREGSLFLSRLDKALRVLSEKYFWHGIFIFGSVTRDGAFRENSDVDIGIEGLDPLQHHEFVGELSRLLERDVDVVLLEECGFGDRIKEKGLKWLMKTE